MITFPGVVTLEDDRVPVIIGIDGDEITLLSGRVEIGKWPAVDCTFVENGDGSWVIEAEHDSVFFLPDDPGQFEKGLVGQHVAESEGAEVEVVDGPPPRPWTVVGFYALAAATLAMGVWAFINVVS